MLKNAVNDRVQDHQKGKDTTEVTHNVGKVHLTMMLKNTINNQDQNHKKEKHTREVTYDVGKVLLAPHGNKRCKQSRSRSPERKRYNRSQSRSLQSPFQYPGKNAVKSQDQDHQKGKDAREVGHDLYTVLLTIMLKNTLNSIKAVHDLQRKVLTTTVGLKYHLRWQ